MRIILITALFLFLLWLAPAFAQEANITPYLRQIESGQTESAKSGLQKLKKSNPNDPSVKFLDAMLTGDGQAALSIYSEIYQKSPKSKYADAALYWVYSYYYAIGSYSKASGYMDLLKKNYPSSSFISPGEKNQPHINDDTSLIHAGQNTPKENVQTLKKDPKKDFRFTIQAGAFLSEENAAKLMDSFRDGGYFTELKKKDVAGSTLNIVNVGKFETETEAHKVLDFINTRYKLSGRIIRTAGL